MVRTALLRSIRVFTFRTAISHASTSSIISCRPRFPSSLSLPLPSLFYSHHHTLTTATSSIKPPSLRPAPSPADVLSLSRLFATPIITYLILNNHPVTALGTFVLSASTDTLDGYIARRYGSSKWGNTIDPICDKVFMGGVVTSMWIMGLLPGWLGGLVVTRDVGLVVGGWLGGIRKEVVGVMRVSRINTVVGVVAICGGLLIGGDEICEGDVGEEGMDEGKVEKGGGSLIEDWSKTADLVEGLWLLWGATTVFSGSAYLTRFLKWRRKRNMKR